MGTADDLGGSAMRLRPFELIEPTSVAEAVDALGRAGEGARVVAGGTALVPMMRLGLIRPDPAIALHRVRGLGQIEAAEGVLRVGAMVTMADLLRALAVRSGWPLLGQAVARVATPAIRSSATVGGNLAYAEAASDLAPALLCLEASVDVSGPAGTRSVPIASFFTGLYETALGPEEIVTGIRVPPVAAGAIGAYVKFCPRAAEDKPLIGVAALLERDPGGRCREVRLALAGAAPTAMRAGRAAAMLRGEALTDGAIAAAADAAAAEADPLSDLMGTAGYRRDMVRVVMRRLLRDLRDGAALAGPIARAAGEPRA
jgi:carbon-monoxide dehydrogenase medium subunit